MKFFSMGGRDVRETLS